MNVLVIIVIVGGMMTSMDWIGVYGEEILQVHFQHTG